MDRQKYDHLVKTFFTCDTQSITNIFQELLRAAAAEESLPPGHLMSQNYDTAQVNPEIHVLPGNLKDARDAIFPFFWGTDGWSSPLHLENVKGPANNASLIGALACLLKNPNLCTDTYSQRSNELEVKAITALANLLFYHTNDPWGVFTMGGTISNMYGARIGIEKVLPGAMHRGLGGEKLAGIVSKASHYCNQTIAGWLGLGTQHLHAIPTDGNLAMRLDLLTEKLDELYSQNIKVAYVVATFGTTDGFGIDDIETIRTIIHLHAKKFGQPPPQLHVDAAVGWVMSFLSDYDTERNLHRFSPTMIPLIHTVKRLNQGLRAADSIAVDFHKMGWGHYPSSAFIVNHRSDLKYLSRTVADTPYFSEADSRRDPALFTLECSRPGLGPYTVMASLNGMGLEGWQLLVVRALELANILKERLSKLDYCQVLNAGTVGPSVCFWVLPKGRNAKEIFDRVLARQLPPDKVERYFAEIRRMYDKRDKVIDPAKDPRLSFTTNMGYHPHGTALPAWKAVFFNPKTDESHIDRLIYSIEEMV